jgi:MFS family permease
MMVTKSRFAVLAVFCLGNGLNEMMQLTFSPIYAATQTAFNVSSETVTLLPAVYLLAFIPASIVLAFLRVRWGLRTCLVAGASIQCLGAILRYVACVVQPSHSFPLLLLGQTLAALAQPVYTNLPAMLSATWFPAQDRALATVAATLANPIGNALGSVVPSLVVPDDATAAVAAKTLSYVTLSQAIAAFAILVATFYCISDEPIEPPSAAAAMRRRNNALLLVKNLDNASDSAAKNLDTVSLLAAGNEDSDAATSSPSSSHNNNNVIVIQVLQKEYMTLLQNFNFIRLLIGFGLGLGVFNALLALLGQLLAPCGYKPAAAGIAGGVMLSSGLFTAIAIGVALRKTGAFVPLLRGGIVIAALAMAGFLAALRPNAYAALLGFSALLGAAAVPLHPLTLENAAEHTYPLSEDASATLLTAAGKGLGVIFVFSVQPLLASNSCSTIFTPGAGVLACIITISALFLVSFQADYRRGTAESGFVEDEIMK